MASIQRTAYPRFRRLISSRELQDHYTPTPHEWRFAFKATRAPQQAFNLVVLLKVVQQLGYVPKPDQIPQAIIEHIRTSLQLDSTLTLNYVAERTLRGHGKAIRKYLQMQAYSEHGRHVAIVAIYEAVQVMDRPLDLINVAIEALRKAAIELPAFSTLDKLVERIRSLANGFIMRRVASQVTPDLAARLDALLITPSPRRRSPFSRLKEVPKRPTHDHFEALQARFAWLEELGDMTPVLASLAPSKIATFAEIATDLDAAALRTDLKAPKRWVVLACFVHRVQVQARDDLADMFVKYVGQKHKTAQKALDELRKRQQATVEELLATLSGVTEVARDTEDDATLGAEIREVLAARGGIETILAECQVLGSYNGNNYLPLLPIAYRGARKVLFRLLDLLTFTPTTEDDGLLPALELLRRLRLTRSAVIPASVSVTFANEQWQRTVVVMHGKRRKKRMFDRRLFELCVFTALADGLRTGDLALQGSERYADYRTHLLSWDECQPFLADYCRELGLAGSAQGSVFQLWIWLKGVAEDVDRGYPDQSDLIISEEGVPTLKRLARRPIPQELAAVEAVIGERMPDRDVLEILCAVAHWTDWPRHFGPRSGFDPKLANATERHILTTFCYGCNLGPAQTERHTRRRIDAQQLATLNRQHVTIDALEAARRDIISCFNQLGLPAFWGDSTIVGVDGTQYDLAEENLVAEYSFRYRTRGGIAYHHVSDRYIALFAHFITCGTWEAIYLIDGLLNNTSEIQPTTVHGDTQAQSTPVFALCYLLGIDLLPRIRNWQDLVFFRASSAIQYQHIDALFKDEVDWELLERHWQDLMQVVLSIKMGKVLPSTLLRKLRHDSKKNKLYKVFRELGYVIRTIVLLRIISRVEMRQQIQGTTNKVEAYQGFSAWITFGNDGMIATNDPVEQEKRMHYKDVVANAVILHNTVDLARLLMELRQEGYPITKEVVARLSPYLTRHIRRFGEYTIDVHVKPAPIEPDFALPD